MVKEVFRVWKTVFNNWRYLVLTLAIAFVFYLFNGIILNLTDVNSNFHVLGFAPSLVFLFLSSLNFVNNVALFTAITTIIISLLIGVLISLLVYRFKMIKTPDMEKIGALGSIGVFLGAAAPGCAACGAGIIGLLGLSSAFAILPFDGQEIAVLAIGIMIFSVYSVSGKLYKPVCNLNLSAIHEKVKGGRY